MHLMAVGACNKRRYPWGDDADPDRANVNQPLSAGDSKWRRGQVTTPVEYFDGTVRDGYATKDGSSIYGAHDLTGNLYEWVGEWFDSAYAPTAPLDDPAGPESGTERMYKSTSFGTLAWPFTTLAGRYGKTDHAWQASGFRCARDVR
jgi:formylglycine-generating enzyme required for sulfatase activity